MLFSFLFILFSFTQYLFYLSSFHNPDPLNGMILFSGLSWFGALFYNDGQNALNRDTTVLISRLSTHGLVHKKSSLVIWWPASDPEVVELGMLQALALQRLLIGKDVCHLVRIFWTTFYYSQLEIPSFYSHWIGKLELSVLQR